MKAESKNIFEKDNGKKTFTRKESIKKDFSENDIKKDITNDTNKDITNDTKNNTKKDITNDTKKDIKKDITNDTKKNIKKDINQNNPKPNTYGFFNYGVDDTAQVNQNGENIHNKGLKSKPSKYKGTLRENDKASKIFPKIMSICILIGTAVGIIAGLGSGMGAGLAVIIIMISVGVGFILNLIFNRKK